MWTALEHNIWTRLKESGLHKQNSYAVAVSGGLDSMVLLSVLKSLRPQADIHVIHCHHGDFENKKFRDEAFDVVQGACTDSRCTFHFSKAEVHLQSEDQFRQFRRGVIFAKLNELNLNWYMTAHHQDDVLETQMLKLIRGVGLDGLAEFSEWNGKVYRPFYHISKKELKDYALKKNIRWIEDPSNQGVEYLRNWLRNEWLPALDKFSEGSTGSLASSLKNLISESSDLRSQFKQEMKQHCVFEETHKRLEIDRLWWVGLSKNSQMKVLVYTVQQCFHQSCSIGALEEIRNLLDKNQNEHTFLMCGLKWLIESYKIVVH